MKLNLGCGARILPGYVNVDLVDLVGVDRVWNLDTAPWPWADSSVTHIEAWDVFEHLNDPIRFMTQCWRVLELGGYLHLHTPHYSCIDAFTDPTHKRFPTEHTFDYWIPGTVLYQHNAAYGGVAFYFDWLTMDNGSMDIGLRKRKPARPTPQ